MSSSTNGTFSWNGVILGYRYTHLSLPGPACMVNLVLLFQRKKKLVSPSFKRGLILFPSFSSESDREHGGDSYRSCPTPSSGAKNSHSGFSFARRSPKPTPRSSDSKSVSGSKSFTSLSKKSESVFSSLHPSKSLVSLPSQKAKGMNEKDKKRDWTRRKSDTKFLKAKHEQRKESLYKTPSKSSSSPQLCQTPTSVSDGIFL